MAIPVTAVTAVAVTGNKTPLRRPARRLPGLRLRCSDKAVLPWAELLGRHPGADRCACGQRVVRFFLPIPAAETNSTRRRSAEGLEPSALPCQRRGRGVQPLPLKKL